MIYRSNLTCPDLTPHFKHLHVRPMPHSFGHSVPSDWADKSEGDPVFGLYKKCGLWTHDEAAILYNVAKRWGGAWADIGAHTGWTTSHIARGLGHNDIAAVDPMFLVPQFGQRFYDNGAGEEWWSDTSRRWFADVAVGEFDAYCIDGDHEPGEPLADAKGALEHFQGRGLCIFHDFIGAPVREAVLFLMDQGFHCRVYNTPHMVAVCWKFSSVDQTFTPPDHTPDHAIDWLEIRRRCEPFPFERTI